MAGGSGDLRAAPWHDWIDFFKKSGQVKGKSLRKNLDLFK